MTKTLIPALVALSCIIAGCRKKDASTLAPVETLPTIASASGGVMILIPAGTFTMGDNNERRAAPSSGTPPGLQAHTVSVSSFYLDKLPVTQAMYQKLTGNNPSKHKEPNNPVERTQWIDAVRFCNECSRREGLTPCYNLDTWECNFDADGYRLPTEAEWEYACRAGSSTKYCFGDSDSELPRYAWLKSNSQGSPHPVGQLAPNRWGLHDMHGNVWQWCHDWYSESYYAESPSDNPRGPATGKMRVLRGGAWSSKAEECRSAHRHKEAPAFTDACFGADSYGFRRARKSQVDAKRVAFVAPTARTIDLVVEGTHQHPSPAGGPPAPRSVPSSPPTPSKIDPTQLKGTIVFVSDRSGVKKIWSMHASGKNAKQLTKGTDPDSDPRFSPDGKRIMYTTLRGGFPEIWMANRDGSDPKSITKGKEASWSPDGASILFIEDNQTFIHDLATGLQKLVTPKEWQRCGVPAFSPDGKRFAVASRHVGEISIHILSLDGKENFQLKTEDECCTPQWSKDGKKLLCQTTKGHIHQVGVDGKNWEQLTHGNDLQHDPRYSPDGTMLLFCRAPTPEGPWQICIKRLDGDDEAFVEITREGSNLLADWHENE